MAKKILFIEDEMRVQKALSSKLQAEGYEVISALDGESGLKMAGEKKPDLILLDLILPKKDGFKVLEALKADPGLSAVPVIILSNLESSHDVERALSLGVRGYLAKANYSLDEVSRRVKEVLEK
jgi:DNA-binding response OmpR family regulator